MRSFDKSWTFDDRVTELRAVQHPSFVRVFGFFSCLLHSDEEDDAIDNGGANGSGWQISGLVLEWCGQGSLSVLLREQFGNRDTEAQTDEGGIGG